MNAEAVEKLVWRFFCLGSQPAAYLPRVFTPGSRVGSDDAITFEASAQADYALLRELFGVVLRRHTPRIYDMGYTELRSEIEDVLKQDPSSAPEQAVQNLLRNYGVLVDAAAERILKPDESLYRARIDPKQPYACEEYDSPPRERAVANRVAGEGKQILCAALDVDTCLFEIRPTVDDIVHNRVLVASLRPTRDLRLLDFTYKSESACTAAAKITLDAFFEPNRASYHLTQILGTVVENSGYDGLVYPSALQCLNRKVGKWMNVALFGTPVADGKLKVGSINRVLIRNTYYEFDLGPVWLEDAEGNHLDPYLKGWIQRVMS